MRTAKEMQQLNNSIVHSHNAVNKQVKNLQTQQTSMEAAKKEQKRYKTGTGRSKQVQQTEANA